MPELFPKRCKVYPRNNLQYISGILEKQKRIELPAELPLSEKELRRCLSYATVYEKVSASKDVLLTLDNYLLDNTDAEAATDVPDDELLTPRDEKEEEDGEEEEGGEEETDEDKGKSSTLEQTAKARPAMNKQSFKNSNVPTSKNVNTYKNDLQKAKDVNSASVKEDKSSEVKATM